MLKEINKAYDDFFSRYGRNPDFISLSRDSYDSLLKESFNNSDKFLYGMHPLVLSTNYSNFEIFEDEDLSQALSLYNQTRDKYQVFTVFRSQPIEIYLVGNSPNATPVQPEHRVDKIEIKSEVIRAYHRHLEVKRMGTLN